MSQVEKFNDYVQQCVWVFDGPADPYEYYKILHHNNDQYMSSDRWIFPIITACERPESYLKYTLFSMMELGIPAPIISFDTAKTGPVRAFKNTLRLMESLRACAHDSDLEHSSFLVVQDDTWVTPVAIDCATNWTIRSNYYVKLYHMSPSHSIEKQEYDIPDIIFSNIDRAYVSAWNKQIRTNVKYDYLSTSNTKKALGRIAANGGCGFVFTDSTVSSLMKSIDLLKGDAGLPEIIQRMAAIQYVNSYATVENAVHHIGSISSVDGRPAEHRMPIYEPLEPAINMLKTTLPEIKVPCKPTY